MDLSKPIGPLGYIAFLIILLCNLPALFAQNKYIDPQTGFHYINRANRYNFHQNQSGENEARFKERYLRDITPGQLRMSARTNYYSASKLHPAGVGLEWIKDAGLREPVNYWNCSGMEVDQDNNLYLLSNEVNLPEGENFYLTKSDPAGNQLWRDKYNGPVSGDDHGYFIFIDSESNVITSGMADFHNSVVTRKHEASGNLLWEKSYTDTRGPNLLGSVLGYDDHIYQLIDLGPDTLIIHKYDKSGELSLLIHDPINEDGVQSDSWPRCFRTDSVGNIYVLVQHYDLYEELVLCKYDKSGIKLWEKMISENGYIADNTFQVNKAGDIYISYVSSVVNERYVSKYNCNGEQIWQNHMFHDCDMSENLIVDDTGQILLLSDDCLECFSESGELLWSKESNVKMNSIDLDRNGDVLLSSSKDGSVFLTKLRLSDGSEIWKKEYQISLTNSGYYSPVVKTDHSDNVYLLSDNYSYWSDEYCRLLKFDMNGILQYESCFDQSNTIRDELADIVICNSDKYYIFEYSKSNLWILHYSSDGSLVKKKTLGHISLSSDAKPEFDNQGFMYFQVLQESKHGVLKLNNNLDIMWSTFSSIGEHDYIGRICFDLNNSGESVVGYVSSIWDDTDGQINTLYVYKYNNGGQIKWQKSLYINSPFLRNIQIDDYGNVYCAVYSGSKSELIKFDQDGYEVWNNTFEIEIADFIIDNWGYPVLKLLNNFEKELILTKFSLSGSLLWQYSYDFNQYYGEIYFWDPPLVCDAYGRIIVVLHFYGSSELKGRRVLMVLDRAGNLQWLRDNEDINQFYSIDNIHCETTGNLYLTGELFASPQNHLGVQKYNFDGELCWSTSGVINQSFRFMITKSIVDETGNIFIAATKLNNRLWSLIKLAKFSQTEEDVPNLSIPELQVKQNFPNPFNNQTTILYRIPNQTHVMLKIYDVSGRLVVDEDLGERVKGEYAYFIDSRYLASGTYYYHVKTDMEAKTGKMVLVK